MSVDCELPLMSIRDMCAICGCDEHHAHDHEHPHHGHDGHGHDGAHAHAHPHEPDHEHAARGRAPVPRTVRLEHDVLARNDALAAQNRRWLRERGIVALNLTSAPGAGKTTLLETILTRLQSQVRVAVIEGDQETQRDADRIRQTGCPAVQINTGAGCHLDAAMVRGGIDAVGPARDSLLFIENVGNLVCPALFDLGEHAMVVVMSVTEGEDKPLKYPHMFRAADAVVVGKIDLLPHLEFDLERCLGYLGEVNPHARVFLVSSVTERGIDELCAWMVKDLRADAWKRGAS
jgi:hydrogenase nickel incorporation protein HypB